MFKSRAQKNFNRCQYRQTEMTTLDDGGILAARLVCPKVEDDNLDVHVRARDIHSGLSSKDGVQPIQVLDSNRKFARDDSILKE